MDNITDVTIGPCESSRFIKPKRIYYKQNGVDKIWDAMKVHDGVAIIIFNSTRENFVFVRQFRPAIYIATAAIEERDGVQMIDTKKYPGHLGLTLELCAGIVDKEKSPSTIAKEEILEECGYDVPLENIIKITSARGGVGTTGSIVHLFYAEVTDAMKTGPGGGLASEGELIDVVEMSIEEGRTMMFDESCNRAHLLIFAVLWFFDSIWKDKPKHASAL
ncbi:uridine diphosphate glucose pyrophosphatase [Elysia marginata]|uniref:Uridine diphosphate glucose pyrophosphatase NUDT14 n=1 Tax=Elysia marginata TaxID=1093978 RepID=A0AAV4F5Q6_9GAST|nr:uridine diphosphate glucose pyrophosphatase [Elysia marginata]